MGKIFFDNGTSRFGQPRQTLKRTTSGYGPLYLENFHLDIKCWLNLSTKISESFGTMESTYNIRKLWKFQFWLAILNFVLFFLFKLTLITKLQLCWLGKICSLLPANSNHPRMAGWENQNQKPPQYTWFAVQIYWREAK